MSALRVHPPVKRVDKTRGVETSHEIADRALAALDVPEGMVFVGWLCRHELRRVADEDGYWSRAPHHRKHANNKRGWAEDKNVSQAFDGAFAWDHSYANDASPICPNAGPVFIPEAFVTTWTGGKP